MKEISMKNISFEDIKHNDENGTEFWYARELQPILDYKEWRKFNGVIERAKKSFYSFFGSLGTYANA